jgi:hypothetical protein
MIDVVFAFVFTFVFKFFHLIQLLVHRRDGCPDSVLIDRRLDPCCLVHTFSVCNTNNHFTPLTKLTTSPAFSATLRAYRHWPAAGDGPSRNGRTVLAFLQKSISSRLAVTWSAFNLGRQLGMQEHCTCKLQQLTLTQVVVLAFLASSCLQGLWAFGTDSTPQQAEF